MDGQTAEAYEVDLEQNLRSLLDRFKSGTYHAPAVRRVHIDKGDGKTTRPIGIPTFEDKVLQRAVAMVLEAVYEQEFADVSYGFRPGRSAHQALEALWRKLMDMGGGTVGDVDVQSFFDSMDHGVLRGFLDRRVRDGVLRRAIDKWLHAGVLEDGAVPYPETGTPQGGVISPGRKPCGTRGCSRKPRQPGQPRPRAAQPLEQWGAAMLSIALASSMAAGNVQTPAAVAQSRSPGVASCASSVLSTVRVAG